MSSFTEKHKFSVETGDLGGSNKVRYISQKEKELPKTKLLQAMPRRRIEERRNQEAKKPY